MASPKAATCKPPLLSEVIFNMLRDRIITGQPAPGERINELAIQQEMDTSRSPIREAVRRLELEGFVEIIPRRGAFVRKMSADDMREAVEVRAQLEQLSAALAAERRTAEHLGQMNSLLKEMDESLGYKDWDGYTLAHHRFHECIAQAGGNQTLLRHLRLVAQPFTNLRVTYIYLMKQGVNPESDHYGIADAIYKKETERAAEMAKQHVLSLLELHTDES